MFSSIRGLYLLDVGKIPPLHCDNRICHSLAKCSWREAHPNSPSSPCPPTPNLRTTNLEKWLGEKIDENNVFQSWNIFVRTSKPVHPHFEKPHTVRKHGKLENLAPTQLHVFANSGCYSYNACKYLTMRWLFKLSKYAFKNFFDC